MTLADVSVELQHMTIAERLELIEMTLGLIRRDLQPQQPPHITPASDARARMAAAALLLRDDYETDPELTAFTALDGEDFLASG